MRPILEASLLNLFFGSSQENTRSWLNLFDEHSAMIAEIYFTSGTLVLRKVELVNLAELSCVFRCSAGELLKIIPAKALRQRTRRRSLLDRCKSYWSLWKNV